MKVLLVGTLLMLWIAGCATVRTREAYVSTPDVRISEPGGGIELTSGETVTPPFYLDVWELEGDEDLPELYSDWLSAGARRVLVEYPNYKKSFFGVLSFHALPASAKGPATRSFSIKLPADEVEKATDGRINVIYEVAQSGDERYVAWALWLSDRPI